MSGLILIFIIVLWIMAIKKLTIFLTKSIPASGFTRSAKVLLFALLLVLPFVDEIIGGFQFRALCETETELKYDKNKLLNKSVYSDTLIPEEIKNLTVPAVSQKQIFTDINTQELLLSYKIFHADGGWLSRAIAFNSVHRPYTFDGVCGQDGTAVSQILKSLNVTVINDPSRK